MNDAGQHVSDAMGKSPRRAPRDCPVCGHELAVTRLGCVDCGTEISGLFASCHYCALSEADLEMLRVFLVSRGNMKELERFLGVSYPTARQRFAELLGRLGMEDPVASVSSDSSDSADVTDVTDTSDEHGAPVSTDDAAASPTREDVLQRLAAGELDLDEAAALLGTR